MTLDTAHNTSWTWVKEDRGMRRLDSIQLDDICRVGSIVSYCSSNWYYCSGVELTFKPGRDILPLCTPDSIANSGGRPFDVFEFIFEYAQFFFRAKKNDWKFTALASFTVMCTDQIIKSKPLTL